MLSYLYCYTTPSFLPQRKLFFLKEKVWSILKYVFHSISKFLKGRKMGAILLSILSQKSGDIWRHFWLSWQGTWSLQASRGYKLGMLFNNLQCTEQSPLPSTTKNYPAPNVNSITVEKLWGRECVILLVSGNLLNRIVPVVQKTLKINKNEWAHTTLFPWVLSWYFELHHCQNFYLMLSLF